MTKPQPNLYHAPTTDVVEQVRQVIDTARQTGTPVPGRPTLIRLTGATDHQIRKALASLATTAASVTSAGDDQPPAHHQGADDTAPPAALPARANPRGGGKLVAWAGFLFGSATSIAANVLAARIAPINAPAQWEPNVYAEIGAAVWPLGLLLSVEVLSRVHWPNGWQWSLAKFGGAGTVALGSAVISYGHIRAVLTSWGYTTLGAAVGPLVIDGLMVISGFALLAISRQRPTSAGAPLARGGATR